MATTRILSRRERRRRITFALLRALAATAVVVALYYLAPLGQLARVPLAVSLAIALLILLVVSSWQVRAIVRATYPAIRAVQALAVTVPLFLLLFAATYFLMARSDPASFSAETLTHTDALYFTVTVFATVGFGDISPASQGARLLVTVQMIMDLLVLGLGIRVFMGAVQTGRQQPPDPAAGAATDGS